MPVTALAPWFGAKRTLAPEIVREMGRHRMYFEIFCGSCAVLMAKPIVAFETVNDLHADLVNLARVVADEDSCLKLYAIVQRFLVHESFIKEIRGSLVSSEPPAEGEPPDVSRAARYMAVSWLTRNGTAGTERTNHQVCLRYTDRGGSPAIRWRSVKDSIPAWHRRLQNVCIIRRDAFELLDKIDDDAACVVYADPPYLIETLSKTGESKSGRYVHKFADEDHDRLAGKLRRFRKTRVIVSYYDSPRLAQMYPEWTVRRLLTNKAMANPNKRGRDGRIDAPEVLLINGPSVSENLFESALDEIGGIR